MLAINCVFISAKLRNCVLVPGVACRFDCFNSIFMLLCACLFVLLQFSICSQLQTIKLTLCMINISSLYGKLLSICKWQNRSAVFVKGLHRIITRYMFTNVGPNNILSLAARLYPLLL